MQPHEIISRAMLKSKGRNPKEFFGLGEADFRELTVLAHHCEKQLGLSMTAFGPDAASGVRLELSGKGKTYQVRVTPLGRVSLDAGLSGGQMRQCSATIPSITGAQANCSGLLKHRRTTMAEVRLKINMIIGGKFQPRGSVLDESLVPENLRIPDYINRDMENREGKVLLLRDLSFYGAQKPGADGIPVNYPVHLAAGETVDLTLVPASQRASLVEGLDYRSQWTFEEAEALRKAQGDIYASSEQLKAEPEVPAWMMNR